MGGDGSRPLSRDAVKFLAIMLMALDHVALVLMGPGPIREAIVCLSTFVLVTMVYFLVEGFDFTRSRRRYAARLLVFALVSQLPYYWATGEAELNIMFSLLFALLLVWVYDSARNVGFAMAAIAALFVASAFCDWWIMTPVFATVFYVFRKRGGRAWVPFVLVAVLFVPMRVYALGVEGIAEALMECAGIVLSAVVIVFLYNGRRCAERYREASKWFFYIFYPAHLFLIGAVDHFME